MDVFYREVTSLVRQGHHLGEYRVRNRALLAIRVAGFYNGELKDKRQLKLWHQRSSCARRLYGLKNREQVGGVRDQKSEQRNGTNAPRAATVWDVDGLSAVQCLKVFAWHAQHRRINAAVLRKTAQHLMADSGSLLFDLSIDRIEQLIYMLVELGEISKSEGESIGQRQMVFPKCVEFAASLLDSFIQNRECIPKEEISLRLSRVVFCVGLVVDHWVQDKSNSVIKCSMQKVLVVLREEGWFEQSNSSFDWEGASLLFNGCGNIGFWDDLLTGMEAEKMIPTLLQFGHVENLHSRHVLRLLQASTKACRFDLLSALVPQILVRVTIETCDQWDLSSIVVSLGIFNMRCKPGLQKSYRQTVETILMQVRLLIGSGGLWHPQCLCLLSTGLGYMHVHDREIHIYLIEMVSRNTHKLTVEQQVDILDGFARLAEYLNPRFMSSHMEPFLDAVFADLQSRLHNMGLGNKGKICDLCHAMTRFRYFDRVLLEKAISLWLPGNWPNRKGTWISRVLYCTAFLNSRQEDLLSCVDGWLERYSSQIPSISCATSFMWSLSVFETLTASQFAALLGVVMRLKRNGKAFSENQCRTVIRTYMWMTLSGRLSDNSKVLMDPHVQRFLKEAEHRSRRTAKNVTSEFEKDLHRHLINLGFVVSTSEILLDGCVTSDFLLKDQNIVVEADGPWHYTVNKIEGKFLPLGQTLFRNRLLQLAGYKVVSVPVHEFSKIEVQDREMWLKEAISQAERQ